MPWLTCWSIDCRSYEVSFDNSTEQVQSLKNHQGQLTLLFHLGQFLQVLQTLLEVSGSHLQRFCLLEHYLLQDSLLLVQLSVAECAFCCLLPLTVQDFFDAVLFWLIDLSCLPVRLFGQGTEEKRRRRWLSNWLVVRRGWGRVDLDLLTPRWDDMNRIGWLYNLLTGRLKLSSWFLCF